MGRFENSIVEIDYGVAEGISQNKLACRKASLASLSKETREKYALVKLLGKLLRKMRYAPSLQFWGLFRVWAWVLAKRRMLLLGQGEPR